MLNILKRDFKEDKVLFTLKCLLIICSIKLITIMCEVVYKSFM